MEEENQELCKLCFLLEFKIDLESQAILKEAARIREKKKD